MSSELPSVAGRMEMTHEDFQRACQVMLQDCQNDCCVDNRWIHILCEAVRCSRECCEIATIRPDAAELDQLRADNARLKSEVESLRKAEGTMCAEIDLCHDALEKARAALEAIYCGGKSYGGAGESYGVLLSVQSIAKRGLRTINELLQKGSK